MLTVVTGPPCSGKSTYAHSRMQPGDVVLDFDMLAQALGSTHHHEHPPAVLGATRAAWGAVLDAMLDTHQDIGVWVIDAKPSPERMRAYEQAGADIVPMLVAADELHRRAKASGRSARTHKVIGGWGAGVARGPQHRLASRKWL